MTDTKIPKMMKVFCEALKPNINDAFWRWFKDSKVVDDAGDPLVVYHATTAGNFRGFSTFNDVGHHFGTAKAADDRVRGEIDDIDVDPDSPEAAYYDEDTNIYPVYLSIQRPILLPDLATWEPEDVAKHMMFSSNVSKQEYEKIAMRADKKSKTDELRKLLKKKGFDGVKYKNIAEDPGSISWIALDPWQIKSVFNKGTWSSSRDDIREDDA